MSSMAPNPLEGKPALRKRLYRIHWCIVVAYGAVSAFVGATPSMSLPDWWLGLGVALAYIGGALNFQADQNVPGPGVAQPVHQTHLMDDGGSE